MKVKTQGHLFVVKSCRTFTAFYSHHFVTFINPVLT